MTDYTKEIDRYLQRLFPICRSITGEGNRETLRILQEIAPLKIKEFPSGTQVFDWVIPSEWEIRGAYIQNRRKELLIDFQESNMHVMSYSQPVRGKMTLEELKPHLYYREDLPDAIPYRTSYYKKDWGFCLSFIQYKKTGKTLETIYLSILAVFFIVCFIILNFYIESLLSIFTKNNSMGRPR